MAGALDALTKEMIYVAVSVTNNCEYCINSHTAAARKAGMSDVMLAELLAVVGMANQTNRISAFGPPPPHPVVGPHAPVDTLPHVP
ncbi:MAG: carboxymuconolactone decarboxylase family protein [Alphaproteobacteria bacterium]|nr:carboxymuconolactone decarboxylase family protein [Alphaproteobacteria bacterium]